MLKPQDILGGKKNNNNKKNECINGKCNISAAQLTSKSVNKVNLDKNKRK